MQGMMEYVFLQKNYTRKIIDRCLMVQATDAAP